MSGVVNTKTLIEYAPTIIIEFGIKLYIKCWYRIVTRKNNQVVTFLDIVME